MGADMLTGFSSVLSAHGIFCQTVWEPSLNMPRPFTQIYSHITAPDQIAFIPVTPDNLIAVTDLGWITVESLCQGVTHASGFCHQSEPVRISKGGSYV